MKKTKILTVLGVLLALGLTACGGKTNPASSGGGKSGGGGGGSPSSAAPAHVHNWVEDTSAAVAPTCDTDGSKTYRCTGEGTCPQNNTKTEVDPALGHQWGAKQDVAASNGGVAYEKYECGRANCGAVKYDISVKGNDDGTNDRINLVGTSALKADSNLPGFVKLNSPNGGSFTISFYSDVYGVGKIYQNGAMDHWNDQTDNTGRGFFSGNSTSETHANEVGNFELKVNGEAVDFSDKKSKTYGDMFPTVDADHPAAANGYSPLAEIETGAVTVGAGLNTISFKRVDSFNIILKSFVLVFKPAAHEHTLPDTWTVVKQATCEEDGLQEKQCSVCKAKVQQVIKAAHDWDDENATEVAEEGYSKYIRTECKVCGKFKYEVPTYLKNDSNQYVLNGTFETNPSRNQASSNKSGTPDGYLKFNKDEDRATFKINSKKVSVGKIYQLGIFDKWGKGGGTNGAKCGYFSTTGNSGADQKALAESIGNFQVAINTIPIDLTQYKGNDESGNAIYNFYKWSGENDEYDTVNNETWSKDILCPIGDVALDKDADVNIFYRRVESYNLAVKAFVLIVEETDHVHTPASAWSSDGEYHWHACGDANCPIEGVQLDKAAHDNVADTSKDDVAAQCEVEGTHYVKCSICEKEASEKIVALGHAWVADESKVDVPATCGAKGTHYVKCSRCEATDAQPIQRTHHTMDNDTKLADFPANTEKGTIATKAYKCTECNQIALRWDAVNFDASSNDLDTDHVNDATNPYVRFGSGKVENKGGIEAKGSHLIYKIESYAAVTEASLTFKIKNSGGNSGKAPVFGMCPNDSSVGYIKQEDGTFKQTTKRYGLIVNGVEYFMGDDDYGNQASVTGWFEWSVEFPLKEGVNTIDVFAYAGYRANLYEFAVTGLPALPAQA